VIEKEGGVAIPSVAEISLLERLSHLLTFARRESLPLPENVQYWQAAYGKEHRMVLFGPVGSRLNDVLLQIADPIAGTSLSGVQVSVLLLGAVGVEPPRVSDSQGELADLVGIVSPASAFLGQIETDRIELFYRQGRSFCLLVTGLEGDPAERAAFREELEQFKIAPLRSRVGPFEVFGADEGDLRDRLATWVESHRDTEHLGQLARVVDGWMAEMTEALALRVAADSRIDADLAFIAGHLDDQIGRLGDILSQERMAGANRLRSALEDLSDACHTGAARFAEWLRKPKGDWRESLADVWAAWSTLAEHVQTAEVALAQRLMVSLVGQMQEFRERYRSELAPWELEGLAPLPPSALVQVEDSGYASARAQIEGLSRPKSEKELLDALLAEVASSARKAVGLAIETLERETARRFQSGPEGDGPIERFAASARTRLAAKRAELTAAAARNELDRLQDAWRRQAEAARRGGV